MKKTVVCILCVIIGAFLSGCVSVNFNPFFTSRALVGTGDREVYEIPAGPFTEIRMTAYGDIRYHTGSSDTVRLEIQSNLREHYNVEVRNGILYIETKGGVGISSSRTPIVTVHSPVLERLTVTGAGNFTSYGTITGDSFDLTISGAASGSADMEVGELSVSLSGAGTFNINGSADTARLRMSGAGSLNAIGLKTRIAEVTLSGVGTVGIDCSERLDINASGVGTVEHRGTANVNTNRGGLVNVRRVD
jgi:hypothetical protein